MTHLIVCCHLVKTVPDGKWLRKNYCYGDQGVLLSVQYESQSGVITTENYTYDNGYNTNITLLMKP